MASKSGTLPQVVGDVLQPSSELFEGDELIKGQIRLYDVESDDEATLEGDARRFFDRTLLTEGLEDSLKLLRDARIGEGASNIHEFYGPYGTGKSHQMVAMYHAFNAPGVVVEWADGRIENLEEGLPDEAIPIVVSLQMDSDTYEYLWEPFFDALDYDLDEDEFEEGGYPGIKTIERAVGDQTVAFFADELEDWFTSLTGKREAANRGFLQALLEATSRTDLFVFVSTLRQDSAVHKILNRQDRVEVNMSNQVDIRDVLRHRLIEPGSIKEGAVRELVDDYISTYAETDHVDLPTGLREEMEHTYPFHPELVSTLKTRYYADVESGATRGMLFLFAKVLVDAYEGTDLITHGDVDAVEYNDELTRINTEHQRPDKAYDDIVDRLDDTDITHGRRIMSTVRLYSLTPGLAEGATRSDIVMGTYRTGGRVNDIMVDLERLQGNVYHLWEQDDDRYVIREAENPRSLIKNAARNVNDDRAMAELGDAISNLFGPQAYTVGFAEDDFGAVPDNESIKVVISNTEWTHDAVKRVIKNDGAGRQWRNTLVFVQPRDGRTIAPGGEVTGPLAKIRQVLGAEQIIDDDSRDPEIREKVREEQTKDRESLTKLLRQNYGEVLDVDDVLNDFEGRANMELDSFVVEGPVYDAQNIAKWAAADTWDLQTHIWGVAQALFERKDEVTIEDLYEAFLRDPSLPIPQSEQDVLSAAREGLEGQPVLAHHESEGFLASVADATADTTLVLAENVAEWTEDDVIETLRSRLSDEGSVDVGSFELELLKRTDVRLTGDDPHDVVMTAVARLARKDRYVLVSGTDIVDKPRSDVKIRDVFDAETVDSNDVVAAIKEEIGSQGSAAISDVLRTIRWDPGQYLPADRTADTFKTAIQQLTNDDYTLRVDGEYTDTLGARDVLAVTVVPTLSSGEADRLREYLEDKEEKETFTAEEAQQAAVPGASEAAVRTFLLRHLGDQETPSLVIASNGSVDPDDYFPGAGFRVPADTGWTFNDSFLSAADLRGAFADAVEEHDGGTLARGTLSLTTRDGGVLSETLDSVAKSTQQYIELTLDSGQSHADLERLFERLPDSISEVDIRAEFE